MTCPKCGGTGKSSVGRRGADLGMYYPPCPACNGTGETSGSSDGNLSASDWLVGFCVVFLLGLIGSTLVAAVRGDRDALRSILHFGAPLGLLAVLYWPATRAFRRAQADSWLPGCVRSWFVGLLPGVPLGCLLGGVYAWHEFAEMPPALAIGAAVGAGCGLVWGLVHGFLSERGREVRWCLGLLAVLAVGGWLGLVLALSRLEGRDDLVRGLILVGYFPLFSALALGAQSRLRAARAEGDDTPGLWAVWLLALVALGGGFGVLYAGLGLAAWYVAVPFGLATGAGWWILAYAALLGALDLEKTSPREPLLILGVLAAIAPFLVVLRDCASLWPASDPHAPSLLGLVGAVFVQVGGGLLWWCFGPLLFLGLFVLGLLGAFLYHREPLWETRAAKATSVTTTLVSGGLALLATLGYAVLVVGFCAGSVGLFLTCVTVWVTLGQVESWQPY